MGPSTGAPSAPSAIQRTGRPRPLSAGLGSACWNRVRGAGYLNAVVTGGEVDEQAAGAAHVLALEDRDPGWDVHQGQGAQVSAEGGGCGPGGGVFDYAAGRGTGRGRERQPGSGPAPGARWFSLAWPLACPVLQSRFRGMSSEYYVPRRAGRRSWLHAVTSFRPPRVRLPPRPGGPRSGTTGRGPGAACARATSAAGRPGGRG